MDHAFYHACTVFMYEIHALKKTTTSNERDLGIMIS